MAIWAGLGATAWLQAIAKFQRKVYGPIRGLSVS
jgi:hypothetical protein